LNSFVRGVAAHLQQESQDAAQPDDEAVTVISLCLRCERINMDDTRICHLYRGQPWPLICDGDSMPKAARSPRTRT